MRRDEAFVARNESRESSFLKARRAPGAWRIQPRSDEFNTSYSRRQIQTLLKSKTFIGWKTLNETGNLCRENMDKERPTDVSD